MLAGHTARVLVGREPIGMIAQVHPDTAAAFGIDEPVFLAELWLEDVVRALPERPDYESPSRFPEVRQDIAILVDQDLPAARVLQLVRAHRSGTVRLSADVFDEYRGDRLPPGKKSLAIRLRYQAADRTLTDDDVARIQAGLIKRLEKELGATLRS
jgi:phenylalanyl-tRNA synthetase beta chain